MTDSTALETNGLTFVLPAWNEELGIERTVRAVIHTGESLLWKGTIDEFEVLVVDDASTDSTPEILARLAQEFPQVRSIRHATNRKLGGSIKTGFAQARGATVLYTDSDLPFDLEELHKAFRLMNNYDADIVAAFRHDRTGEGPRRLIYSYVYNSLIAAVFGLRIRDVNFAAKLIRREVLESIELHSEGSFIDVELLAKAERSGFRCLQFGVDYFPRTRGISTLSSGGVILKILREMREIGPEIRATRPLPRGRR
jgi:glycosyltransferase involved in cell wall biosynthesis